MNLVSAILFIVAAGGLMKFLVNKFGGPNREEISWWTALGLLLCARLVVRGVLWLFPTMDLPVKLSVCMAVYVVSMMLCLLPYRVPPIRGVLIGLAVAVILTIQGFLLVAGLNKPGP